MVYRFCFDNKDSKTVMDFYKFASLLDSVKYLKIEYSVGKDNLVKTARTGFIDVMCSKNDYETLFCWLREKHIIIKIMPIGHFFSAIGGL